MSLQERIPKPWFRQLWPWLLISGPAVVVVAGTVTAVLAVRTQDGLVADDYYKQGLSVNKDLSRDLAAKTAGYQAEGVIESMAVGATGPGMLRIVLTMPKLPSHVDSLNLNFSRATVSGSDRQVLLQRSQPNTFIGSLTPLQTGKWYLTLDDMPHSWRLKTQIVAQHGSSIKFSFGSPALSATDK